MKRMGLWLVFFAGILSMPAITLFGAEISTWTGAELKALPEAYWTVQHQRERQWRTYCAAQADKFSQIYGNGIRNSYDLFLKEQAGTAVKPPVVQAKTLKRLTDVACLPGRMFGALKGTPLPQMRLVAYKKGALRVIPFDIVEFTAAGRVVLPAGPEANPKDGDGVLSENDRLFFLAVDAGHKVDKGLISETFKGVKEVVEIELAYAPDNERGWAYLAAFADAPPEKSPLNYIVVHSDASMFYSPFMLIQARPRLVKKGLAPTVDVCSWVIAPAIGGTMLDIHNKFFIDIKMGYRLGVTMREDQDDFDLSWRAWYEGSVIGFSRVSWKVSTPLGIGAPVVFADVVASPFALLDQNFLNTPFDPSIILKSFTLAIGEDLNTRVTGDKNYRILTAKDRQGQAVEAKNPQTRTLLDNSTKPHDLWHVLTGPSGTMCMVSGLNDFLTQQARFRLEYRDAPDSIGRYDYVLDLANFKNRQENMYLEWNVVPFFGSKGNYQWKNLDLVLKHTDKPLSYSVDGGTRLQSGAFTHIPDIKAEKRYYRY